MPRHWDTPGLNWDSGATWDEILETVFKPKRHMASNALPETLTDLLSLAEDGADGADQHEAAIPLLANTEAMIRADLSDLAAKKAAHAAFDTVLPGTPDPDQVVQTARTAGQAFLLLLRGVMEPVLGGKGQQWVPLGWPASSLAIPSADAKILPHLAQAKNFLTANPGYEINTPVTVLTAARATALHSALDNAVNARNTRDQNKKTALQQRDTSETKMRKRLRGLIGELEQNLDPLDARWLAFGLNRPGADDPPAAPLNTLATPLGGGQLFLQCDRVPRAKHYQYWIQIVGVDADFRRAETWSAWEKILTGLPPAATVKAKLRAVNDAGEGAFGSVVEAVIT